MADLQTNPTNLTVRTTLAPSHARTFSKSRSPSRSPVRKARFAARELDPVLSNLDVDHTIQALQQLDAIGHSEAERTSLARNISDATEAERSVGIRAALAAKKIKEWTREISAWPWPNSRDRAWGAGFLPSTGNSASSTSFGSLSGTTLHDRQERIDEIYDAMETLGLEDLKQYVFGLHVSTPSSPAAGSPRNGPANYGRMRDFTALITATVMHALPDQAQLEALLHAWRIRLDVLRHVPELVTQLDRVKKALQSITTILHDPTKNRLMTAAEVEETKELLGDKVYYCGAKIDMLLDLLEGQEDSLPQVWIDAQEDLENKYAAWVAQAEQIVLRNQLAPESSSASAMNSSLTDPQSAANAGISRSHGALAQAPASTIDPRLPDPNTFDIPRRKPLLDVASSQSQNHRRGISEVSAADSTYSIENAQIMDAHSAKYVPSSRVSMIDPYEGMPTFPSASPERHHTPLATRPDLVHSQSTMAPEVVNYSAESSNSHPAPAHRALPPPNTTNDTMYPARESERAIDEHNPQRGMEYSTAGQAVAELTPTASNEALLESQQRPLVPRRSSKRLSSSSPGPNFGPTAHDQRRPTTIEETSPVTPQRQIAAGSTTTRRADHLDDKIRDILTTLPNKAVLAYSSGSDTSSRSSSRSSMNNTRAISPVQTLKLSPAKNARLNQGNDNASDVRVYNLTLQGRSRTTPPKQLFVRSVGNPERVMCRVGGGWADLAEYLREYASHHGGGSLNEQDLDVVPLDGRHSKNNSREGMVGHSSSLRNSGFDFGLNDRQPRVFSDEPEQIEQPPERPLPFPHQPAVNVPHATSSDEAVVLPARVQNIQVRKAPQPVVTTVSSVTPRIPQNGYVPLGAAGPVQQPQRAPSGNYAPRMETIVSNGTITTINHGPTMSTTMTVTSPVSRRNNNNNVARTTPTTASIVNNINNNPRASPAVMSPINNNTNTRTAPAFAPNNVNMTTRGPGPGPNTTTPVTGSTIQPNGNTPQQVLMNRTQPARKPSLLGEGGIKRVFLRGRSDRKFY